MKWRRPILVGLGLLVAFFALAFVWVIYDDGRVAVRVALEGFVRSTPDRAAAMYVEALTARDEQLALARWTVPPNASDSLLVRRRAVTKRLLGTGTYRVTRTEWWSTCCMPHVIPDEQAKYAGFARLWVDLDGVPYVFDVSTARPYDFFMDDGRPRAWVVWDVYPAGEQPLHFNWSER